ncbi:hypothetical protein AM1_2733 [Acaryochloris marina MBIC11017]|uniref:Uncharacterized protein n=1 Tax=Acaryochloris marina (strain MBIC 11017) TaxID=329726 RepID=B0C849_ACAM1|nr:hypothetical protein AM1_2733 [Acaryochloris marina MBIC11017]
MVLKVPNKANHRLTQFSRHNRRCSSSNRHICKFLQDFG